MVSNSRQTRGYGISRLHIERGGGGKAKLSAEEKDMRDGMMVARPRGTLLCKAGVGKLIEWMQYKEARSYI